MPEEVKPVNQKGYISPIVPDHKNLLSERSSEIDPYELMSSRLKALEKPEGTYFTNVPGTVLPGTGRYEKIFPGEDMEEFYGRGQSWGSKMVNGIGKGLSLTGTTFLQSTAGTVNGLMEWINTGRFASFYDNDFNRTLDEYNKNLEDTLPNYYTAEEKDADWYSPKKWFTANFLWDGIIKNMGFSAGAALSGLGYAAALNGIMKTIPLASRLFSVGKAAETLAATEEALLSANKVADTYGKLKSLSDKFLSSYNSLNFGGRAVVAGLATTGEAGFEAYQNLNQFRNQKIEEYKNTHGGIAPTGDDLEKINTLADSVGNSSFFLNTALLTATNYIQFPKILGSSYKVEKGMINGLSRKTNEIVKDAAGNIVAKDFKFGKILSTVNKVRPYTFSASEAFEEGAQYSIQVGTQDYYNKAYERDVDDVLSSVLTGINETFGTNEGMENVLIGGLSGALMTARGKYRESRERNENTKKAIVELNKTKLSDFSKDTADSVKRGIVLQQQREQALKDGDVLESKDLEKDYIINYLSPRIKYGRMDMVRSDINDLRLLASSEEGFAQLLREGKALEGDTREAYLQRLANLENTAENIKSLYQSLNLRYGNLITKDGKPLYSSEVMDKMVYAATKIADYDQRVSNLQSQLLSSGLDTSTIIEDIVNGNFESYDKAIEAINAMENKLTDDQLVDMKQSLQDIAELTLRRQKFLKEYNDIKKSPEKYKEQEVVAPEKVNVGETVKIKTKVGEKEYTIGEEYYLGTVIKGTNEQGFEEFAFPTLTILADNGDGTIKIKDSNGKVRDIEKSKLEQYKLGKVSSLEKDKKGKFFYDNRNVLFEFNFGKGKKVQGRLEYSQKERILMFKYFDKNGKPKSIEVTGDQFVPRKGYSQAMITPVGTITALQQKSLEDYTAEKDERIVNKREVRLNILNKMFDETSEKLEETKKLINRKYSEFEKITNDLLAIENKIKAGELTKRQSFKKTTGRALQAANRLSRMQEQLRKEIQELEAEQEELETLQAYVADMAQNIDELPTDSKEFLEELREQVKDLESLHLQTGIQINSISKLIDQTEGALNKAIEFVKELIGKFEKTYPKTPTAIIGQEWVDFLNANPNFLKINTRFKEDLAVVEDLIAQIEDLDIIPGERTVAELREQLNDILNNLSNIEKELSAKQQILNKFEAIAIEHQRIVEENQKLQENEAFIKKIMGTADNSQRTLEDKEPYEEDSKKTNTNIPRATIASSNLPGYVVSQLFGNNPNVIKKVAEGKIKAIIVTRKNQREALGEGVELIEHLGQGKISEAEMDGTIAVVMVEEQPDGSRKLVGKDGQALEAPSVENMVYQVMPTEELKWSEEFGGKSMFREGTPSNVQDDLRQQYKEWRKETLENPPTSTFRIEISFGNPERVPQKDDDGNVIVNKKTGVPVADGNAKVSVSDAALISDDDLENRPVLRVPTTNDVENVGTTFFKNVRGRVFLVLKNGLVKLQNRQFSKKEATVIYQAIRRLSEIMFEEEEVKSEEAQRLLNWLKSTVYWGTPKDAQGKPKAAGYNSIFFDRTEVVGEDGKTKKSLRLFFSNKDGSVPFTPSYIKDNESQIIALIQELYNNVNATMVNGSRTTQWDAPYEEILEVKSNGEVVSRRWPNYQSYLLSSKNPDGSNRKAEELPLFTNIRPKQNENDVNRQGVYFVLTDLKYNEPVPQAPEKKKAPVKIVPGAKTAVKPVEAEEGEIDLSGEKINTFTSPIKPDGTGGKEIKWAYNPKKSGWEAILVMPGGDLESVLGDLTENLGEEKAKETIKKTIYNSIPQELFQEDEDSLNVDENVVEQFEDADTYMDDDPNELAAEEEPEKITILDDEDEEIEKRLADKKRDRGNRRADLRVVVKEEVERFEGENWTKIEKWLKENFPNLPVYRVKNILKGTNGIQAWGMLKNGALYIYENAEVGTIYHEVFEGVWKIFSSPKERREIVKEFTSRKGTFIDRPTGKVVAYKDATNAQVKEQLAEEFRDYVQYGKIPEKPIDRKPGILKLFADIVNAVKNFFANTPGAKSNTERLFQKIGTGYYKNTDPLKSKLSFAKEGIIDVEDAVIDEDSELRLKFPGEVIHDIMQELTYVTLTSVIGNNEDLFNVQGKSKSELYNMLRYELLTTVLGKASIAKEMIENGEISKEKGKDIIEKGIATWKLIRSQWEDIVKKHEEYLRSYNIEFDENDDFNLKSDENTGRGEYESSDKIDHFRKTNSAIKLLLSTLPLMENGREKPSSIGGATLLPLSQVYISLMNNLHTSRNIDEMIERIRQMAIADENYRKLYRRLTGTDYATNTFDFSDLLQNHELQLINAIWTTFKKQSPDAKTVFIFENGDVSVGDSNLASAARQIKSEYETALISKIRKQNPYFEYSDTEKVFVGKPSGIRNITLTSAAAQVKFLNDLGISFTEEEVDKLPNDKRDTFNKAVSGIRDSIKSADKIATIGGKTLEIEGRLLELSLVRASINNPEFDSTFFNVKGERTQTFMGTNAISDFFDAISQIQNLNELAGTQYEYLLGALNQDQGDVFAENSTILGRMFNLKTGERKESEMFLRAGYVDGTLNHQNGKRKSSANLTYKERLIQEINANLKGYYTNLVPADASLEHTAYMGNSISEKALLRGFDEVFLIFKGYLESEIKLSRDDRPIKESKDRKRTDLRFFKGILGEELHNRIVKDKSTPVEEIYEKYKKQINPAIESFIKKDAQRLKSELTEYGIIKMNEEGEFVTQNIAFKNYDGMSEADLNRQLNALSVNYMISNIELHKLIYSDPYQYEDELKRIKNFLSPRQAILHSSVKMNNAMNTVYNRGYSKNDIGRTDFNRDYFRTISYQDVLGTFDFPGYDKSAYKETDGAGIIGLRAYRNFRIRAGSWTAANEAQYKYDMAWEKQYKKIPLSEFEKEILKDGNPEVKDTYTTLKPIVSGNKANGNSYNDVVLDKYALYPLSFRVMMEINPKSNVIKLYNKMQKEDIDYVVFDSGRKVGAVNSVPLYNAKGEFNTEAYNKNSIVNIPFAIMSIQAEIPSKEDDLVTRGSQVTKLVTMDFLEAGVPLDFEEGKTFEERYAKWISLSEDEKMKSELYKEIKNNQMLLEAMVENGYQSLLKRMGIDEVLKDGKVVDYKVTDFSKAAQTLREEILKRETNDNITDALSDFLSGNTTLEATPVYQQVRNILYSIADKEMISPKITGGMKVQLPSTLLESVRAEAKTITTEDGKQKTVYASDNLKFYSKTEDGKKVNVCQIMVGRWFKSDMTDDELMKYFNSEEGKKILSGIGFRIPTQKQNSIDAFEIKRLLPAEFGDNIIVPAEIVNKQGSDFDIDKLSLYLKNLFTDNKGNLKLVPYFGTGKEALDKFEDMFYDMLQEKIEKAEGGKRKISGFKQIIVSIANKTADKRTKNKWLPILRDMFGEDLTVNELEEVIDKKLEDIVGRIEDLSDFDVQEKFLNRFKTTMYKRSLENAYVESLEKLVTHPKNFDQLMKPNSADQLKKLAGEITSLRGFDAFDYKSTDKMLSRLFMSRLRYAFVSGKYAIGIAAVNQTNHSLNQRQPVFINDDMLDNVSEEDKMWLGDGQIKFDKYNSMKINGKEVPVLSMIKNKAGEFISDLIGQFIDGYVDIAKGPWIMELGASQNVASTWLFLIKLGVPVKTVAYFMNQPIIRDYLSTVENAGYSWLFIDNFVEDTLNKYKSEYKASDKIPSETQLKEMIGKYSELNKQQLAQQQLILKEFLKYAKMANHMFLITQGSNFDTSNFNDPFLVFKKTEQLKNAQKTIIASIDKNGNTTPAVNALLENSFIGKLAYRINSVRDAFGEFLHSDKGRVRNVLENVLLPYINVNDRDFVKLARKAVSDLFDWAIQTSPDKKLNLAISNILLSENNAAEELQDFFDSIKNKKKHPLRNNYVVQTLAHQINGEVNNMALKNRDNKVYDQNKVIYAFEELRNYLNSKNQLPLYKRLVAMSILQSGVSTSKIAFTQLLPYEDFKNEYSKILSKLNSMSNIDDFYKLGVFQRNNWNNDDIVPHMKARLIYVNGEPKYNPAMAFLPNNVKKAIKNEEIPQVMTVSTLSREANSEYVVFTWEKDIPKSKKKEMKKRGDFSYIQKGLFKRVKESDNPNSDPLTTSDKKGKSYYIYKMVNAWGNSFSANEFYTTGRKSVIDNGFLKVDEVSDAPIINAFIGDEKTQPKERKVPTKAIVSQAVKGNITLNIIEDWVQSGQATTTVRNSSYHNSFYKGDGVYTTDKGNLVNITYRGLVKLQGDKVVGNNISYTKDEFAKAEGFGTWENFKKGAKYAGKTLIDGGSVHLYDIKPAQAPVTADEASIKTPIEGLNERLDSYGNAKVVLPANFYEGDRPKGRLNAFKSAITKVADNLIVLGDLNLKEFDFLSEQDKKRLDALRSLAEELRILNINDISLDSRRTVAVEKRYAQLTNTLANEFVDIMGKHVEKQLGKKISSSKPRVTATFTDEATLKSQIAVLEEKKKTKGITASEMAKLIKLQTELGKIIKSQC